MKKLLFVLLVAVLFSSFSILPAQAAEEFTLTIKNHRFEPETLEVPAGQKLKILVQNQDATPEEFESHALNREKIIGANSSAVILIGPLEAGTYPFVGEFNEDSAKGQIIAR
ncbi:MAG: cupredoxin domain-containing protein [Alphaproteobacteria bacterium]|nr:cupredoxin domain-containing protein [Alphaproteobacteria bacterium]